MKNPTLDSLINEGKNIKNSIYINEINMEEYPSYEAFESWVQTSKRFLLANYKDDIAFEAFEDAIKTYCKHPPLYTDVEKLIAVLVSCKNFPEKVQRKSKPESIGTQINNNLTQNQNLSINIFLEAIKDELAGKQVKEIKEIIETEKYVEKAKPKVIEKLKSFGVDTLSNIIANIATSPNIFNMF